MTVFKRNNLILFFLAVFAAYLLSSSRAFAEILDSWENEHAYRPRPVLFLHGFAKGNSQGWEMAFLSLVQYYDEYSSEERR